VKIGKGVKKKQNKVIDLQKGGRTGRYPETKRKREKPQQHKIRGNCHDIISGVTRGILEVLQKEKKKSTHQVYQRGTRPC